MIKDGFITNKCDKCFYTKTIKNTCIIVCLYIDDMLILETNIEIIKFIKRMLSNNFDMKDLRVADIILEIKITKTPDEISLSQSHFVNKMIKIFKKYRIKENTNLFLPHIHLRKNTKTEKWQLKYSQIIKSLIYLMNCHRPDIAYALSKLSRYTSNPSDDHWTALLWVVGYVSNTKEYTLRYEKFSLEFEGYNDTNWIADYEKLKSTSGYIFTLGGTMVS